MSTHLTRAFLLLPSPSLTLFYAASCSFLGAVCLSTGLSVLRSCLFSLEGCLGTGDRRRAPRVLTEPHLNQDTWEAPPPRPCVHTQPLGDASGSSTPVNVISGLSTVTRAVSVSSRLSFTRHTAWRCARVSACINGPSPSFLSRTDLASTFGVCLSVTDFYAPTSLPLHLSRSVLWPRIYTVSPGTSLGTCEQRALHACWVEGSLNVH